MVADTDTPVLVADVGGTNLNLALLLPEGPRFRLLRKARFSTQDEGSLLEPIRRFLASEAALRPGRACLAGAGPVLDRRIHLTHAPWDMDARTLEHELRIPVHLVNDFTALSCGVAALDRSDANQVTALPHGDGSLPAPDPAGLALVVGVGTGLGVGFLVPTPQGPRPFPSEGGHMGLPVFNDTTLALWRHLAADLQGAPEAEMAVSGPGLARLLHFLLDTRRAPRTAEATAILGLPAEEQPAAIGNQAGTDPACRQAMDLFVDLYARICADLCAVFLPTGGLYLAGGLTAKNAAHLLAGGRFMAAFEPHDRPPLDRLTRATPVYLIRDYDLSLYGAAHALAWAP